MLRTTFSAAIAFAFALGACGGDDERCTGEACVTPTCEDNAQNGDESGVDCGGDCGACLGAACVDGDTCASGFCNGLVCVSRACGEDPCAHGGTCVDTADGRTCQCPENWTGTDCEISDGCHASPCGPGTCNDDGDGGFDCVCVPGTYTSGATCALCAEIANCDARTCTSAADAQCTTCSAGFEPVAGACVAIEACDPNPCGDGTCTAAADGVGYDCVCAAGAFDNGATCRACPAIDDCQAVTCTNMTDATCATCDAGFEVAGAGCVDIDDCAAAPCGTGTCRDVGPDAYTCTCLPGTWSDGATCVACASIADCAAVTCTDASDATCAECDPGFERDTSDPAAATCVPSDDCSPNPCNGGTCTDKAGGYDCTCPLGLFDSGVSCIACDPIANCNVVACTNADDATCRTCAAGFAAVANACVDIDDCAGAPCGVGTCTDTGVDAYDCTCPVGHFDDGDTCVRCDNISNCTASACTSKTDESCTTCADGFEPDGNGRCRNIDGCAGAPCGVGTCVDALDGYTCRCPAGRFDDGTTCAACTAIAGCTTLTCTSATTSTCSACASGFVSNGSGGCADKNDCAPNPCAPGTCADTGTNAFDCTCPAGRYDDGAACKPCSAIPNCTAATCTTGTNAVCTACADGFVPDGSGACVDKNDCIPNPCSGNTCTDTGVNAYTCATQPGQFFDGTNVLPCTAIANCISGLSCTNATDSACGVCAINHFGPRCTPVTTCSGGQYQVTAPTPSSDRVCAPVTTCTVDQYETAPPTGTSDRVCMPLTVCTVDQYQTVAPSATSNRACALLTVCTASQYQSTPASPTSNRACSPLTVCTGAQYESTLATPTSDRACSPLTTCTNAQYEFAAPTATTNRDCRALTTCLANQFEEAAPTPTKDRDCTDLTVCTGDQYESLAATLTRDRECTDLTVCTDDEYELTPATTNSDRVCEDLLTCTATQWESSAPTATTNRGCTNCASVRNCTTVACSGPVSSCVLCRDGYESDGAGGCRSLGPLDLQLGKVDLEFALAANSPGLLTGASTHAGDNAFTHVLTALMTHPGGAAGTVSAYAGPLVGSTTYSAPKLAAETLELIVRTAEVWHDQNNVSLSVVVRDALGQAQVAPTNVSFKVALAGQTDVTGVCTTGNDGTCNGSLDVPLEWFGANATAQVSATAGVLSATAVSVTVHGYTDPVTPTSGVHITLPLGPRRAGTSFVVPVVAYTNAGQLGAFDLSLAFDTTRFDNVSVVMSSQLANAVSNVQGDGTIKLVGVAAANTVGPFTLAQVTLRLRTDLAAAAQGAIGGTIKDLLDPQSARIVAQGTAISGSGNVVVAANPVRGLVAIPARTQLFDLAPLGGVAAGTTIMVRAMYAALPDVDVTSLASCQGAPACTFTAGANDGPVAVAIDYGGKSTTAKLTVWKPQLPLEVTVGDTILSPVADWLDGACTQTQYQTTRVYAEATFEAGADAVTGRVMVPFASSTAAASVGTTSASGSALVTGLAVGTTEIRALGALGAVIGVASVTVDATPVTVEGLDVVVLTDIVVEPVGAGVTPHGERAVTALAHQVLDAEFAVGDVLAWARLSDDTRQPVTPAMGLKLISLDEELLAATSEPPEVTALNAGEGELVEATWTVCGDVIADGLGAVTLALPAATGGIATVNAPRISWLAGDPATAAGVPTSATVNVRLDFANGTFTDFTLDERTVYDDSSGDPDDLFTVTVAADKVTVHPTGNGVGQATLNITFPHTDVELTATVNIVRHASFTIGAHPWPAYPGSDAVSETTLSKIEGTSTFQSAVIDLDTVLSDGFVIDISTLPAVAYVAAGAVEMRNVNRVFASSPSGAGTVTASLSGASSDPLAFTVDASPITVTAATTSFPTTFSGAVGATQQLTVSATFSDNTQRLDAHTIAGLFDYTSNAAAKVSIDVATGVATLHENHNRPVILTAAADNVSGNSTTAANLLPIVGDVDLGETVGVAHPDRGPGVAFAMPVRVNTGTQSFGALDLTIEYDPDVITAVSAVGGPDWPGGQLDANIDNTVGRIHVVAAARAGATASGAALRVVTLNFVASSAVGKPETLVHGFITKFLDNTLQLAPIGAALDPGETRAFVAGHGLLDPTCGAFEPEDFRGNSNANCEFEVGDVSFALQYLAGLIPDGQLAAFQRTELDADLNGAISVADAVYLLRVLVGKFAFADFTVTAPQHLADVLTLEAVVVDKAELPVTGATKVYFELGTSQTFVVTEGTLGAATPNGRLVEAVHIGAGLYRAKATSFTQSEDDVGVVPQIRTFDAEGATADDRIAVFFGSPAVNPLMSFDAFTTFDLINVPCFGVPATDCCVPSTGVRTVIDDGNACTTDTCNASTGEVSSSNNFDPATECCNPTDGVKDIISDGNACTTDTCNASTGEVSSSNNFDPATECCNPTDGVKDIISDGNACTTDTCNASTGEVSSSNNFDPATECCNPTDGAKDVISDGNACTTDTCNASTGEVSSSNNFDPATECCNPTDGAKDVISDGNACTTDTCNASTGEVSSSNNFDPATECCNPTDGVKDIISDGNACTTDTCNASTGEVSSSNNFDPATECCNPTDGVKDIISDGNACTTDTCNASTGEVSSSNNFDPATECCNPTDGVKDIISDGNACTTDTCNASTGEVSSSNNFDPATECCNPTDGAKDVISDGNACTTDTCNASTGEVSSSNNFDPATECCNPTDGGKDVISDGNACTTDTCNASTGEVSSSNNFDPATECCNPTDGAKDVISDGNACTTDTCNASTGEVSSSDNFDPATECCNPTDGGKDVISDGNACTTDTCNASTGEVSSSDNFDPATECCNPTDGAKDVISDGNACTTDTCNASTGEVSSSNNFDPATECCNPTDGAKDVISDGNACTTDTCNASTGEVSSSNNFDPATECCNPTDGGKDVISDGNACTTDTCNASTGEVSSSNNFDPATECCNPTDGGKDVISDGNACTTDTCNASTGEVSSSNNFDPATECCNPTDGGKDVISDGNACTTAPVQRVDTGGVEQQQLRPHDRMLQPDRRRQGRDLGRQRLHDGHVQRVDRRGVEQQQLRPRDRVLQPDRRRQGRHLGRQRLHDRHVQRVDRRGVEQQQLRPRDRVLQPDRRRPRTSISDGNASTTDTCNASTGEVSSSNNFDPATECCNPTDGAKDVISDGNACTTDTCNASTGEVSSSNNFDPATECCNPTDGVKDIISDGNACTTDTCNASTGEVSSSNNFDPATECCNPTDGAKDVISDGNACTTDTCNASTGEVSSSNNFDPATECCNPTDGAKDVISDGNACTTDTCNASTGEVSSSNNFDPATECCNPTDGVKDIISDGNACTTDTCNASTGEVSSSNNFDPATECCNPTDGGKDVISDGNACTTDTCNASTGEVSSSNNFDPATECCNPTDGVKDIISDGNACTTDTCNASTGEVSSSNNFDPATECCNPTDGVKDIISDGNACTTDTCNASTGVVANTPNAANACDDGDADTYDDSCDDAGGCDGLPCAVLPNCADVVCTDPNVSEDNAYDAIPSPLPGNLPSLGFQATQASELGDAIRLDNSGYLRNVTVGFSNWALYSTYASDGRYSADNAHWTHPITVNVYAADPGGPGGHAGVGALLWSKTEDVRIPWRPEADPEHCAEMPTAWWDGSECFNGLAFEYTFDLSDQLRRVPTDVIVTVAYDTQTYGAAPIGEDGPYNSLNVALSALATNGTDIDSDVIYWDTSTSDWYTDLGAAGSGILRFDTNWSGYVPALRIAVDPSECATCANGFALTDGNCVNVDDCTAAADAACQVGAGGLCVDGIAAYTCDCPSGYFGDATTSCTQCQPIANCAAVTCTGESDESCVLCSAGYWLDQVDHNQCKPLTPCELGEYELQAPGPTDNRVCADCDTMTGCTQVTCTDDEDESCLACQDGYWLDDGVCSTCAVLDNCLAVVCDDPDLMVTTAYDAIPHPLPSSIPSLGFEATSAQEVGDAIILEKAGLLREVTVGFSDWAVFSDYDDDVRYQDDDEYWSHPITINVYDAVPSGLGGHVGVGALRWSKTEVVEIPWRPVADPVNCPATPTAWWDGTACFNGYLFEHTFDLSDIARYAPREVIVTVAYNTQHRGYAPIGQPGPYNSLNVGLSAGNTIGRNVDPDVLYWNTTYPPFYSDAGAAGVGVLRYDDVWTGYVPALRVDVFGTEQGDSMCVDCVDGFELQDDGTCTTCTDDCFVDATNGNDANGGASAAFPLKTIQRALAVVSAAGTVHVAPGQYAEVGQIVIDQPVTIAGAGQASTIVHPSADTTTTASDVTAARGWIHVREGARLDLSGVTLDGLEHKIHSGILFSGNGSVTDSTLKNMKLDASGPQYAGRGINIDQASTQPAHLVVVSRCTFSDIGRIHIYVGHGAAEVHASHFIGKGIGNYLDYGVEVGRGATAIVRDNTFSAHLGVASSDGSTSAAIYVHSFHQPGTSATITGNVVTSSSAAIAVGYAAGDTSLVTARFNSLAGNAVGIESTTAQAVTGSCNWWGSNTGPGPVGPGSGAPVTTQVGFRPWLRTAVLTEANCDQTAPTVAIAATPDAIATGGTSTVSFTLSEAASDFVASDVVSVGGVLSDFSGSGVNYTATFTADGSTANASVSVAADKFSDNAGNFNGVAASRSIDVTCGVGYVAHPDTAACVKCITTCYVDEAGNDANGGAAQGPSGAFKTIKAALAQVAAGGSVIVASGTYIEDGQVVITKDVAIQGAGVTATTVRSSGFTATSSGPTRGWFHVTQDAHLDLSDVTLDGQGAVIHSGVLFTGNGTVSDASFVNFTFSAATPEGRAINVDQDSQRLGHVVSIERTTLENYARVGIYAGHGRADVSASAFTGKGAGHFLDYGVEVERGAGANVLGNTFRAHRGIWNADDISAAVYVTTYFNDGSWANVVGNSIEDSLRAIAVGYRAGLDVGGNYPRGAGESSVVTAHGNSLSAATFAEGDLGLDSVIAIDADCNWWGNATGPGPVGPGAGVGVTSEVDYRPWLTTSDLAAACDVLPPSLDIAISASPLTAGQDATVTFTLSESSINFVASDVVAVGGTLSDFQGSGLAYSATFTANNTTTNGSIAVAAGAFTDLAGNVNPAPSSLVVTLVCADGYKADGAGVCQDLCDPNSCLIGECTPGEGATYTCTCPDGTFLDDSDLDGPTCTTCTEIEGCFALLLCTDADDSVCQQTTIHVTSSQIPDEEPPQLNIGSAPERYGPDSWMGPSRGKTNWHAYYDPAVPGPLQALFPEETAERSLTLSQLASISYSTFRPSGTAATRDWWITIYTRKQAAPADNEDWYYRRYISNYSEHDEVDAWTRHSTTDDMTFQELKKNLTLVGDPMSLSALASHVAYGDDEIFAITIQTDSQWPAGTFTGSVDGLEIVLTNGKLGRVDFGRGTVVNAIPGDVRGAELPGVTSDSAPMYGPASWTSPASGETVWSAYHDTAAPGALDVMFPSEFANLGELTVAELGSLSFSTRAVSNDCAWMLEIATSAGDFASDGAHVGSAAWTRYTTDVGLTPPLMFDDMTLDELRQAHGAASVDAITVISQEGCASSIDGLEVRLTSGVLGRVDFTSGRTVTVVPGMVPDENVPREDEGAAPGPFGPGAWMGPAVGKTNWYAHYDGTLSGALSVLFPEEAAGLKVSQIQSISYYTKRAASHPSEDWFVQIYTRKPNAFYLSRLSSNYGAPATIGQWQRYSTDDSMQFDNYTPPNLDDTDYRSMSATRKLFKDELVGAIAVQSNSPLTNFQGGVDGLEIKLTNGKVGRLDFAPGKTIDVLPMDVPEGSETPVAITSDAPPGWGVGAWQGPVAGTTRWSARHTGDGDALAVLFPTRSALTLGDLASISYFTKRPDGAAAGDDWSIAIETDSRTLLNDRSAHTVTNTWVRHTTAEGLRFVDDLATPDDEAVSFQAALDAFGDEPIVALTIRSHSPAFAGLVDGLEIHLSSGHVGRVDLGAGTSITVTPSDVPDAQYPRTVAPPPTTTFGPNAWFGPTPKPNYPQSLPGFKSNWHARYIRDGGALDTLFPANVGGLRVQDIASISYFTDRPTGSSGDWYIKIYTRPTGVGDKNNTVNCAVDQVPGPVCWYHRTLLNNYGTDSRRDQWVRHSSGEAMTFRDEYTSGTPFKSLSAYRGSAVGLELVEMISVQTASNDNGSVGAMDGLEIKLTNGLVGRVNFNAGGESCVEPDMITDLDVDGVLEAEGDLSYAAIGDDFDPVSDECTPFGASELPSLGPTPDQVFAFIVPTSDVYEIKVEPLTDGLDLHWSLYEGGSCSEAQCLGVRNVGEVGDSESHEIALDPSKQYFLVVDTAVALDLESSAPYEVTVKRAPRPATIWINEFHYNNTGADVGEAIEIAGPVGFDLTNWKLYLYNGANGESYSPITTLSGTLATSEAPLTLGTKSTIVSGIQNGSPDGIALVRPNGQVEQFISYGGTFTAADGPAQGLLSVDVGVAEPDATLVGRSLQLGGQGCSYAQFTWRSPATHTFDAPNHEQTLLNCPP